MKFDVESEWERRGKAADKDHKTFTLISIHTSEVVKTMQTVQNKGEKLLSGLPASHSLMADFLQKHSLRLDAMHDAKGLSALVADGQKKGPKLPSFFRCAFTRY